MDGWTVVRADGDVHSVHFDRECAMEGVRRLGANGLSARVGGPTPLEQLKESFPNRVCDRCKQRASTQAVRRKRARQHQREMRQLKKLRAKPALPQRRPFHATVEPGLCSVCHMLPAVDMGRCQSCMRPHEQ